MSYPEHLPGKGGEHNLFGVYVCPVCKRTLQNSIPFREEHLPVIFHLTQNNMLNSQPILCEDCHRAMWLSKAYNWEGRLVFDSRQWMNPEFQ